MAALSTLQLQQQTCASRPRAADVQQRLTLLLQHHMPRSLGGGDLQFCSDAADSRCLCHSTAMNEQHSDLAGAWGWHLAAFA